MLTLYYKPSCYYCRLVIDGAEEFGIELDLRDVTHDMTFLKELKEKGGLNQVPFLIDESRKESLYESTDIITYLKKHYGDKSQAKVADEACIVPGKSVKEGVCQ